MVYCGVVSRVGTIVPNDVQLLTALERCTRVVRYNRDATQRLHCAGRVERWDGHSLMNATHQQRFFVFVGLDLSTKDRRALSPGVHPPPHALVNPPNPRPPSSRTHVVPCGVLFPVSASRS